MIFKNAVSWFEIPAIDINRAQKFYEAIFDIQMISLDMPQLKMRLFPIESPMNIGGAICYSGDFYKPSAESGPLVYLNGNPDCKMYLIKSKRQEVRSLFQKHKFHPSMVIWPYF
jgi:predicted enzyme related to lactoylglutathione lyase